MSDPVLLDTADTEPLKRCFVMVTGGQSPEIDRIGVIQEVLMGAENRAERKRILDYCWSFWSEHA